MGKNNWIYYFTDFQVLLVYLSDGKKDTINNVSIGASISRTLLYKFKKSLYDDGIINIEKIEERDYIFLTERGHSLAKFLLQYMDFLGYPLNEVKDLRRQTGRIKEQIQEVPQDVININNEGI